MSDRREEILKQEFDPYDLYVHVASAVVDKMDIDKLKNAMDEYMKEMCLEFVQYLCSDNVFGTSMIDGVEHLYFKGEYVTKEQLFENFL